MRQPEAAVSIVHARDPEEAVLLMRRTERDGDSWSGHWSFPGGHCAPSDSDLLATALRELEEECGVRLRSSDLEAALPPRIARRAAGPYLLVAPFVLRTDCQCTTVLDRAEAVEAAWVSLAVLRDPMRHRLQPVPGCPPERLYPAVAFSTTPSPTPLWGFTYRLLTEWLGMQAAELPLERAGRRVANSILEFLQSHGVTLLRDWCERTVSQPAGATRTVQEARLAGTFPAAAVLDQFCRPAMNVDAVNLLEVRPDRIRVVGAAFEEYILRSTSL
jgi:8-oxo-dGTP pyrophosphatase MutT (NUDIX family)